MVAKSELVQLLYNYNIIIIYTLTTLSSCEESCGSLVNRNLKMKCDQFMTLYFPSHSLMAIGPSSNPHVIIYMKLFAISHLVLMD